jgi:hypothetical protein
MEIMTTDRIKEIQSKTAYPESVSVQQALLQVWNECEQEQLQLHNVSQEKRTVCPDCGDYGWIYSDDGTRRKTCPCHY